MTLDHDKWIDDIEREARRRPTTFFEALTGPEPWERQRDLIVVRYARQLELTRRTDDCDTWEQVQARMAANSEVLDQFIEEIRRFDEVHEDDIYRNNKALFGRRRAKQIRDEARRYRADRKAGEADPPLADLPTGPNVPCMDCQQKAKRTGRAVYCMSAHREAKP